MKLPGRIVPDHRLPGNVLRFPQKRRDFSRFFEAVAIDQVGVDVDLPPGHPHGETRPLDLALVKQCLRVVKLLLSRGASPLAPPTPTYGWTALHFAAAHPEFAEQFIRQGADPFAVSVDGDTPLGLMTDSVKARVQQALVERERNVLQATLQPEDVTGADVVQDGTALRARVRL